MGKLEGLRTTAWQVLSATVLVLSLAVTARGDATIGPVAAAGAGAALLWFTFVRATLARGAGLLHPSLAWGSVLVENTAPWAFYAVLAHAGTGASAHHDWGPVLLFGGCHLIAMLRLNPAYSLFMGVLGAAQYLAVTFLLVAPVARSQGHDDFGVAREAVRSLFFVGGACVAAWVAYGLRGAVGGVVRSLRSAELFGKYRLERELASGGMGVVWLATYCPEGGFERPAAVKLVHAHLARDPHFLDSFRREAALGARLVHSHIVQTFDFGVVDDRPFLAMEYVDGPTLRDVLVHAAERDTPIPPDVAGGIARGILAGLAFAHGGARDQSGALLRVIHRDLAPSNILITEGGSVKVTDFGIARALRERGAEDTSTVAGHFDHMAPEQAQAASLDERTDLFCVGILLWEMLCGRPLFRRANEAATLVAVATATVPLPSTIHLALRPWDALCARALARDPAARFASADDMIDAIANVDGGGGEEAIARYLAKLARAAPTSTQPWADGPTELTPHAPA